MDLLNTLVDKGLRRELPTREEALAVLATSDDDLLEVVAAAGKVRRQWFGRRVKLNYLVNLKSGLCPEDCSYCSQRLGSKAEILKYTWLKPDEASKAAAAGVAGGAKRVCLVASGRGPTDRDVDRVSQTIEAIKEQNEGVEVCACLGLLSEGQAGRLRSAGADAYNHNLNTSEGTYGDITTTHTYADRVETVQQAQAAGLSACSGLIAGMGESDADLVDVVFSLRDLDPDSVPVNFLIPFEGTPLAKEWNLTPQRCLRILAMVRFVCPDVEVRLAGGREVHLRSMQPLALHLVNSIFLGDYLTSEGQAGQADLDMIADAGFEVEGLVRRRCPGTVRRRGPSRRPAAVAADTPRAVRPVVTWPTSPRSSTPRLRPRARIWWRSADAARGRISPPMPDPLSPAELRTLDRAHVWHPYGPMPGRQEPLIVESASGVRLRLAEPAHGQHELIDGMSSWWSAVHGYNHPVLNEAARGQLDRMSHVMFGGLTHEPAVRLAARLVEITPEPLRHVFLADSGSVSVEVAVKMCLQYWHSTGRPAKKRLLTWRGGYHGDTWQPMSVCDPEGGMHGLWSGALPQQVFADEPPGGFDAQPDEAYVQHLWDLIARHADELAAVIVEPVVQGAGGMRFHSPAYLRALREACDAHDVLLVFDEIASGFGRTGKLFAAGHAGISPDVMCVGKALTGGYLTLAATLCTSRVADGISRGEVPVLAHGPTFMGNPLAAAVALASIDLLLGQDWQQEVKRLETGLRDGLGGVRSIAGVRDVRVLGAIGVVQLDHDVNMAAATEAAVREGVWLRPFRDLIYTMPPYVTGDDDLARICRAVCAAAREG